MPDMVVCTQCGGMLNEDYSCPYCGARYKKPETSSTVTNIIINNNYAPAPTPTVPAPVTTELEPEPEPEPTHEPPTQDESESEPEPTMSGLTEFVNNSLGLMCILLIAAVGLCIYGVNTDNELLITIGIIVGVVFVFLSSKMKPRGKDDDNK